MKPLTHKEVSSRGGIKSWKDKSPKERNKIMKERWLIRRMNSEVNKAINNGVEPEVSVKVVSKSRKNKIRISRPVSCLLCNKVFLTFISRKYCQDCSLAINNQSGGRERTREMVRIRDNHTCQKCGKIWVNTMRKFDVHHLNGDCGKYSRSYDNASDLTGMITLCHKCHMNQDEVIKKMSGERGLI